jgi:hypothetical protein
LRKVVGGSVPMVEKVLYHFVEGKISGRCVVNNGTGVERETTTCLEGTFDLGPTLSFALTNTLTNETSHLLAANEGWYFPDDAPSVNLHRVSSNDSVGETALITTVTNPNACNQLKICIGEGMEMVAPIGILLLKMDDYGVRCH